MDALSAIHHASGTGGPRWVLRRWGASSTAAIAAFALLTASCSHDQAAPPPPIRVRVVHDGATVAVRSLPGDTVGQALDRAQVVPAEGQVLSVGTNKQLGRNGHAAELRVGGRTVHRSTVLQVPSTVTVVDGADTTEHTRKVRRPVAAEGLPNALQYVQYGGEPGLEDAVLGVRSGEVASRQTIEPGVPAHRSTGKVLALTFDDGPDPVTTPKILKILKAKHVPATFCEIGTQVDDHPELSKRIVKLGHQLCNHTLHHVEGLETQPRARIEAEVSGGAKAIERATGSPPAFYRPPGGSLAPIIYDVAGEHDEHVLYWSIDPRDWKRPAPMDLVTRVVNQLVPGGIVLLHDGGGNRDATVAALPAIIDYAQALGYTFVVPITHRSAVG